MALQERVIVDGDGSNIVGGIIVLPYLLQVGYELGTLISFGGVGGEDDDEQDVEEEKKTHL